MRERIVCVFFAILLITGQAMALEPVFMLIKIDGPVHDPENGTFWYGPFSEGCAVFDVNDDSIPDITCGANWYEGPEWIKHEDYRDNATIRGEFVNNNGEYAVDVNRDGLMDIVSAGWFEDGVWWYENPGKEDVKWNAVKILPSVSTEALLVEDIDGDGDTDILVNHWTNEDGQNLTWLELLDSPSFRPHTIGIRGDRHGCGLGDINGDERKDIITADGWYESPANPLTGEWIFHPEFKIEHEPGTMSVFDVNRDGLNDIIYGQGHTYGLFWLEQTGDDGWTEHVIEDSFGQFHVTVLADINQDGEPDLVTGKRLRGHNGADKSSFDPLFLFWYEIDGGAFRRHILSFNHLPWYPNMEIKNTVPNYAVSAGMNINITDVNSDGLVDIICSGKSGLYLFLNRGLPPTEPLVK